jgi:hypothetical protein
MPRYGRPSRFSKKWKKYSSARKIQRRWRKHKYGKNTNMKKLILSNRKAINTVRKDIEIKYLQGAAATSPNYVGQYLIQGTATVDFQGFDTAISPAVVGLRPLDGLVQGTQANQRIGDWIKLKRLTIRYKITSGYYNRPPPLAIGADEVKQYVTIIVVKDMEPTMNLPGWSQIFYTQDVDEFHPQSTFKDLTTVVSRFKVLKKVTRVVKVSQPKYIAGGTVSDPSGITGIMNQGKSEVRGSIHIGGGFKFQYDNTGAFTHCTNQNLYILACSNVHGIAGQLNQNLPKLKLSTRVAFRDG